MWKKLSFGPNTQSIEGQGFSAQERWQHFVENFDFLSLIKVWPQVVGPMMAEHSIPLRLKNRTLFVLTKHPAFSQEMSFLEKPIIKKLGVNFPEFPRMVEKLAFEANETFFVERSKVFTNKAKPKETLHPYSPEYRRLKAEAEKFFGDASPEEKERWISLYIQMAQGE